MVKVNLSHVDMDCENVVAFTSAVRSSNRVSIVDNHMLVCSYKLVGKDLWSNKRQLWTSEDGRKSRDVALAERGVGGKNMIDG